MDAYYIWNLKPNEKNKLPPLNYIKKNSKYFRDSYLLGPDDINKEVSNYRDPKVSKIWNIIPWWIVKCDIARLIVIYNNGGFYLDVDCKITKNFINQIKNKKCILFTEIIFPNTNRLSPREDKNPERVLRVANYAFGCITPKHPFIKEIINECIKRLHIIINENNGKLFTKKILPNTNELDPREDKSPKYVLRVANYVLSYITSRHPFIKKVINKCIKMLHIMLNKNNDKSKLKDTDILWLAGPDVITSVYHTKKHKYRDILLLDKSYAKNIRFGSWR